LAVRLSALEGEILRVERVVDESMSGPVAERFRDEATRQVRLIDQVRRELLAIP